MPILQVRPGTPPRCLSTWIGCAAAATRSRFAVHPHRNLQPACMLGVAQGRSATAASSKYAASKLPYAQFGGLSRALPADLLAQTRFHQLISVAPRKRPAIGPPAALLPFLGCMQQLYVGAGATCRKGQSANRLASTISIITRPGSLRFPSWFLVVGSASLSLPVPYSPVESVSGSLATLVCYTAPAHICWIRLISTACHCCCSALWEHRLVFGPSRLNIANSLRRSLRAAWRRFGFSKFGMFGDFISLQHFYPIPHIFYFHLLFVMACVKRRSPKAGS
jgi:hypothetical protein